MKGRKQKISEDTCQQRDRAEPEVYAGGQTYMRITENNITNTDKPSYGLLEQILSPTNVHKAYKKVKQTVPTITDSVVYLRAIANYNTSTAGFYYNFDNITYTKLGTDLSMKFNLSVFTGNKFCLFNFATVQTGGFVDIDWFSTEPEFSENKFYDSSFVSLTKEALTLTDHFTNYLSGMAKPADFLCYKDLPVGFYPIRNGQRSDW
jgi:Beta xylosidase C-terminal Concanavalin A-like domain